MNPTRFIQPEVLSRISSLELLARGVVEGFISGLHRSPYKGFSVEFMSYRPYMPGDDLMHVDWKLFARTDRFYVKEFEDETNTRLHILLDVSGSMEYASGVVSKRDYASYLAASMAHLMIRQRDAVGLTLFDEAILQRIPPRSTTNHLLLMLRTLEQMGEGRTSDFGKPLHLLADEFRRRGFMILISDLLGDADALIDGLQHFRYNGHEVMVFHILDPQEVQFDFEDMIEFEDMETGEVMLVSADAAKELYLENFTRHQTKLRDACAGMGVDYIPLNTDRPLDAALFNYLAARSRRT